MRLILTTSTTLRLTWLVENGRLTSAWRAIDKPTLESRVPARAA